jgi:hypothetical protein
MNGSFDGTKLASNLAPKRWCHRDRNPEVDRQCKPLSDRDV